MAFKTILVTAGLGLPVSGYAQHLSQVARTPVAAERLVGEALFLDTGAPIGLTISRQWLGEHRVSVTTVLDSLGVFDLGANATYMNVAAAKRWGFGSRRLPCIVCRAIR